MLSAVDRTRHMQVLYGGILYGGEGGCKMIVVPLNLDVQRMAVAIEGASVGVCVHSHTTRDADVGIHDGIDVAVASRALNSRTETLPVGRIAQHHVGLTIDDLVVDVLIFVIIRIVAVVGYD